MSREATKKTRETAERDGQTCTQILSGQGKRIKRGPGRGNKINRFTVHCPICGYQMICRASDAMSSGVRSGRFQCETCRKYYLTHDGVIIRESETKDSIKTKNRFRAIPEGDRGKIISREKAKAEGLHSFFTGVPCSKGHISDRFVSNSLCRDCGRLRSGKHAVEVFVGDQNPVWEIYGTVTHTRPLGARFVRGKCQSGSPNS